MVKNKIQNQLYAIIIVHSKSVYKSFSSKLNELLPEDIPILYDKISGNVMNYSLIEMKRLLKIPLLISSPDLLFQFISNPKIPQIEPRIIVFDDIDRMFIHHEKETIQKIMKYFSASEIQKIIVSENQVDKYLNDIDCDVSLYEHIQNIEQNNSKNVGNILLNYFAVPEDKRLLLLYSLLINNLNKKIIVSYNSNIVSNVF